ncbi:MAG: MltR family transcriptional regulator [Neptuniibacter sp.]
MTNHEPIPFNLDSFSVRFREESDRACAVLGAALLDARLEGLFRSRFKHGADELLSNSGPLGTFSARSQLAFALDWIDANVFHDLNVIRKIRNEFAHSFDHELSFTDQSIEDRCKNLRTPAALIDGHEVAIKTPNRQLSTSVIRAMANVFDPPRSRLELTVEFIVQHLIDLENNNRDFPELSFLEEVRNLGERSVLGVKISGTINVTKSKG